MEIPANGDPQDTNLGGKLRYLFDSSSAPEQGCGLWSADSVTTSVGASGGMAAGNPFPAPPIP